MFSLEGKKALVTGASRGIGQAIYLLLKERGADVTGTATTAENAAHIPDGRVLDISDSTAIEKLIQTLITEKGQIDILVNNAGITRDNLLLRMKNQEWHDVINTNLNSVYHMSKACLKSMLKSRWGRIINISSVTGLMGNPGQTNYAAAKAGLIGFTKSLAPEVASRGITVNAIAPGFIETQMTAELSETQKQWILDKVPANRLGTPVEIAYTVAFLASEEAAYITGETIQVNGGLYMQ